MNLWSCRRALGLCAVLAALFGCSGSQAQIGAPTPRRAAAPVGTAKHPAGLNAIAHVVIIIQENRTVDDLFNGFPGANTVKSGLNSSGQIVPLKLIKLTAPYLLYHKHKSFVSEYDNGKLDGWNLDASHCEQPHQCPPKDRRAFGYVPLKETKPYWTMAEQYAFADSMFQTNQGPSYPAHQYLISGTSTISDGSTLRAAENPYNTEHFSGPYGGCDSPIGTLVSLIDQNGKEGQRAYPCFNRVSLAHVLDNHRLTWRYYQDSPGPGLWKAYDSIREIRFSHRYRNVITPSAQVLTDIGQGKLANVTWVTPSVEASDHSGTTNGTGPSWVASVVNTIGESKFWNSTVIFVTWDDWGGWFDHVKPPQYNSYELSFRVPLIVISPYAKAGYVSHVQHEFGSILKFIEQNFALPSMHTTDVRADNLSDCFNSSNGPRRFEKIDAPLGPRYFLSRPPSNEDLDSGPDD